ncbi:hypothetical protein BC938DRAFT_476321 [Jimgerdemannia flammicorona]|uniref:Ribosomal RNA-processing protein 36 n=1 Tax=Jimgerdemannia flammicorona TaxID=994334 RepID=A0A433QQR1_9FUNG|nr:hypothetical protein BC938DRAFT_476321 [Jimgerdemannia flammicorona]
MSRKPINKQVALKRKQHRDDSKSSDKFGRVDRNSEDESEDDGAPEEFRFGREEVGEEESEEDGDDDDGGGGGAENEKLKQLQRSLAHIPFEKLAEIQQKVGMKEFHKSFRRKAEANGREEVDKSDDDFEVAPRKTTRKAGGEAEDGGAKRAKDVQRLPKDRKEMKRSSKNKPVEQTSKRPVGRFREVVGAVGLKRRDPRFDQLSGKLNQDLFEKSYSFLDGYKSSELSMLREQIRKEKNAEEKTKLQELLTRMVGYYTSLFWGKAMDCTTLRNWQSRDSTLKIQKHKLELKRERKKVEMEFVKKGKKPFFLKKSDEKKLELIQKFESLKGTKNFDKILEKKRKRNAAKEHRHVPYKRRSGGLAGCHSACESHKVNKNFRASPPLGVMETQTLLILLNDIRSGDILPTLSQQLDAALSSAIRQTQTDTSSRQRLGQGVAFWDGVANLYDLLYQQIPKELSYANNILLSLLKLTRNMFANVTTNQDRALEHLIHKRIERVVSYCVSHQPAENVEYFPVIRMGTQALSNMLTGNPMVQQVLWLDYMGRGLTRHLQRRSHTDRCPCADLQLHPREPRAQVYFPSLYMIICLRIRIVPQNLTVKRPHHSECLHQTESGRRLFTAMLQQAEPLLENEDSRSFELIYAITRRLIDFDLFSSLFDALKSVEGASFTLAQITLLKLLDSKIHASASTTIVPTPAPLPLPAVRTLAQSFNAASSRATLLMRGLPPAIPLSSPQPDDEVPPDEPISVEDTANLYTGLVLQLQCFWVLSLEEAGEARSALVEEGILASCCGMLISPFRLVWFGSGLVVRLISRPCPQPFSPRPTSRFRALQSPP